MPRRDDIHRIDEACEREQTRLDGEVERLLREPGYQSFAYQRSSYLARGRYAEQLEAWLARVPAEQLLILSAEDFLRDTAALFREVTRFLDLPDHELAHYERHNAQRYPAMSPVTREALGAYFRPHNQRLYTLLGRDFGWDA